MYYNVYTGMNVFMLLNINTILQYIVFSLQGRRRHGNNAAPALIFIIFLGVGGNGGVNKVILHRALVQKETIDGLTSVRPVCSHFDINLTTAG